ncbi:inositol monophosphatase [Schizopora paradoxa]|uniref:Inositol-1-monophosphatase n=1 Tax=Schizopora paradoxa TaxID=27342 RepID=A0A0H2S747_9AGAM|nr:inositol monophosphatase [Schizopora paradoxa]
MSELDLAKLLEFSISLAKEAGELISQGSDAILSSEADEVDDKKNSVDLVTKYDKAVEELVNQRIKKAYPTFAFVGEEGTSASGSLPVFTDEPTFCVDPIDGTTNFVHGFPFSVISIGLIYKKRAVLGVIFNPFLDWLYYATEGNGAWLVKAGGSPTKLPLHPPRPLPSLSKALIAVEWGSDRSAKAIQARADSFSRLAGDGKEVQGGKMAHSLRSIGSAAMNFAMVASGQLDIYWEIGCWPWDVAAGIVIVQEAGGLFNTSDLSLHNGEVTGDSTDKVLTGRKYIAIRPISDAKAEKGKETQKRLVKEFCETIVDFDAN